MDKQEAIETLKKSAPRGCIIISSVKEKDDGGRAITFSAASINRETGKIYIQDITLRAATATDNDDNVTAAQNIYFSGSGANFALEFVQELGLAVWEDKYAYEHYLM